MKLICDCGHQHNLDNRKPSGGYIRMECPCGRTYILAID